MMLLQTNDLIPSHCQALAIPQCCCVPSFALLLSLDKGCDAESNAHHGKCQGHGNKGFAQHSLPCWQRISHQLLQRNVSLPSLNLARMPVMHAAIDRYLQVLATIERSQEHASLQCCGLTCCQDHILLAWRGAASSLL